MLKGIPKILSPELVKTLMEMGHGDEIIIADGNFPSESQGPKVIRADGHGVPEILTAILKLFPLDPYVDIPVTLMDKVAGDKVKTPIWDEYKTIIKEANYNYDKLNHIDRFEFYDRAKTTYAIIATGEKALYANVLLKKGVVIED